MRHPKAGISTLIAALLAGICPTIALAESFEPADPAAAVLQTRTYQNTNADELLRASLAVVQDIRFLVTESETAPGLIVAIESPRGWGQAIGPHTLTLNLQQVSDIDNRFQIRLSLAHPVKSSARDLDPAFYSDFYQDFFKHLDRNLFNRRTLK
jgi:hypothetical protein